jgi:hypothetical protein
VIFNSVTEMLSLFVVTSQSNTTTAFASDLTTLAVFFALFVIEKDGVLTVNLETLTDPAT